MMFEGDYVLIKDHQKYKGLKGKIIKNNVALDLYAVKLLTRGNIVKLKGRQLEKIEDIDEEYLNKSTIKESFEVNETIIHTFKDLTNRKFAIINIKPKHWQSCMENRVFGLPKNSNNWPGDPGTILLVRHLRDSDGNYGVKGIWFITEIEQANPPYYWEGQWDVNIYMEPIIQFDEPFNEVMRRVRKQNGSLGGSKSSIVRGLKGWPHLQGSLFPMTSSDKNVQVLMNYLEEMIRYKRNEVNFGDFEYSKPVNDDLVLHFIEDLDKYVDSHL